MQLQAHGGVLLQELGQDQRHRRLCECDRTARLDGAARFGARELHRLERRVRFRQHRGRMPVDLVADIGDDEAARGAVHQAHVEFRLERHHVT